MNMNSIQAGAAALALSVGALGSASVMAQGVDANAVLVNYADIAHAGYEDSLTTAKALDQAVDAFLANPTEDALTTARNAWLKAREPYQQTEAYRFGNAIVDDWEGRVNAWPLDEGLIDYVDPGYGMESDSNGLYTANVIANPTILVNGTETDASEITPDLIANVLQEAGGVEANVASGYHAVEFLLWGQDLHGTDAGKGERPATDFDTTSCTNGNCDRRADYLRSATDLLISDLVEMVAAWDEGGDARAAVLNVNTDTGLGMILTGMGSMSYGELAGQRMKLGLLLHDPEEEHDCFSDNTHHSHYYDALGIQNVYLGRYVRIDGSVVEGPSLSALVADSDPALDEEMTAKLATTMEKMSIMVERGETVEAYDQMIGEGNDEGNAIVQAAIDGLVDQTSSIERVITALNVGEVSIEGSDSLDSPDAVFD